MSQLKRLILLVFFCQLVACGQKGALLLIEDNYPDEQAPPTQQPTTKSEKNETIE